MGRVARAATTSVCQVGGIGIAKNVKTIQGVDKANKLRLRAFNITGAPEKGACRILGYVGQEQVADFTDDVIVRVPNPA